MRRTIMKWNRVGITKGILITLLILVSCQYLVNVLIYKTPLLTLNGLENSLKAIMNQSNESTTLRQLFATRVNPLRLERCPYISPKLKGRFAVKTEVPSWISLENKYPMLLPGGRHKPTDCMSRNRVAIIIPFRDREIHLKIFLNNLHEFLQRQQLDYGIFVVEMAEGIPFNRALLMNVGFLEASKLYDYDCFVFHDVDLLPEDDRNLYSCPQSPRHMSVAIDRMNYKLPYTHIFGGVSALSKSDFVKVNGFSNLYFGWGGEDDDMYRRIIYSGFTVIRYAPVVARYKMLVHAKDRQNPDRWSLLRSVKSRQQRDGINTLNYTILDLEQKRLYTWVRISVNKTQIMADEPVHRTAMNVPKLKPMDVIKDGQNISLQSSQNVPKKPDVQQVDAAKQPGGQQVHVAKHQVDGAGKQPDNAKQHPVKPVRVKLKSPKIVSWVPPEFNGTVPKNLTQYEPLPIKTLSPHDMKRREQSVAALQAQALKLKQAASAAKVSVNNVVNVPVNIKANGAVLPAKNAVNVNLKNRANAQNIHVQNVQKIENVPVKNTANTQNIPVKIVPKLGNNMPVKNNANTQSKTMHKLQIVGNKNIANFQNVRVNNFAHSTSNTRQNLEKAERLFLKHAQNAAFMKRQEAQNAGPAGRGT